MAALAARGADEVVEVFPENWRAFTFFARLGTRWVYGMNGVVGLRYEAIYPLMDRMGLSAEEWDELLEDLEVMEQAALAEMRSSD